MYITKKIKQLILILGLVLATGCSMQVHEIKDISSYVEKNTPSKEVRSEDFVSFSSFVFQAEKSGDVIKEGNIGFMFLNKEEFNKKIKALALPQSKITEQSAFITEYNFPHTSSMITSTGYIKSLDQIEDLDKGEVVYDITTGNVEYGKAIDFKIEKLENGKRKLDVKYMLSELEEIRKVSVDKVHYIETPIVNEYSLETTVNFEGDIYMLMIRSEENKNNFILNLSPSTINYIYVIVIK